MSETATLEAGTVTEGAEAPETQSSAPEQKKPQSKPQEKAQPAKADSLDTPENAEKLRLILRREKEDPNVRFTDAELDLYDAYTSGKLKPGKRPAPQKAASPLPEGDKPKEKEEATPEPEPEEESEEAPTETSPDEDAKALMKEVGAKSLKEAHAKIKELRSKIGGKDAQAVARLAKEKDELVRSAQSLWSDVKAGKPEALSFVEKTFGFKAVPLNVAPEQAKVAGETPTYIDPKKFIDEDSAQMVNAVIDGLQKKVDRLVAGLEEDKQKSRQEHAMTSARMAVVDEMVEVAQGMEAIKGIQNLRGAIESWYNGKADSRLEAFNDLFEIAKEEGCSLKAAATIKRGRDADRLIAEAEERGLKKAYGHKPNPSLSGSQGGKGQAEYQPLTDEQIDAMADDFKLMPNDWFDKEGNPLQNVIPKAAWRIFGFKSSR
jgi:hypothetical protein